MKIVTIQEIQPLTFSF